MGIDANIIVKKNGGSFYFSRDGIKNVKKLRKIFGDEIFIFLEFTEFLEDREIIEKFLKINIIDESGIDKLRLAVNKKEILQVCREFKVSDFVSSKMDTLKALKNTVPNLYSLNNKKICSGFSRRIHHTSSWEDLIRAIKKNGRRL